MIHYFQVMNKELDYYRWAIEGDVDLAEQYLQDMFVDVRYINSKEIDYYAKGNKVLPNGLKIRGCKFSHTFKSKRTPTFNTNFLPIDKRHSLAGGDAYKQTEPIVTGH